MYNKPTTFKGWIKLYYERITNPVKVVNLSKTEKKWLGIIKMHYSEYQALSFDDRLKKMYEETYALDPTTFKGYKDVMFNALFKLYIKIGQHHSNCNDILELIKKIMYDDPFFPENKDPLERGLVKIWSLLMSVKVFDNLGRRIINI